MTTDNPKQAKFLPAPGMFEERRDVDASYPRADRRAKLGKAFQPLLEAVQRLDADIVRLTEQVEDARRAKTEAESEKRLDAIREHLQRPIKARMLQTEGYGHRSRFISWGPEEGYN